MFPTTATTGVSLADLFNGAQVVGTADVRVGSCTSDWQQVQPGDAFVALLHADGDGHDDAQQAVSRGAAAIVCERRLPIFDVPQFIVSDTRQAYGKLCHALVGNPCESVKTIGVTGTSGKTSVSVLFDAILTASGVNAGTISTLGCWDGISTSDGLQETPKSPALAQKLAEMAANGCSHAVVELSTASIAQSHPAGMQLDAVCITNIDRDAKTQHYCLENYRNTFRKILDHLAPHGVVVLNADDPNCCRLLAELDHPVLTFGMTKPAEVTARIVEQFVGEQTFLLTAGSEAVTVRTRIIGAHHIQNCLAAATLALAYGIDLTTIGQGLQRVEQIAGRMERIELGQGFGVWLDSADSPQQLRATLQAIRNVASGRVTCIWATEAVEQNQIDAGRQVVDQLADCSVVIKETAATATGRMAAASWAIQRAQPGDAVVMVGLPSELPAERAAEREWIKHLLNEHHVAEPTQS